MKVGDIKISQIINPGFTEAVIEFKERIDEVNNSIYKYKKDFQEIILLLRSKGKLLVNINKHKYIIPLLIIITEGIMRSYYISIGLKPDKTKYKKDNKHIDTMANFCWCRFRFT